MEIGSIVWWVIVICIIIIISYFATEAFQSSSLKSIFTKSIFTSNTVIPNTLDYNEFIQSSVSIPPWNLPQNEQDTIKSILDTILKKINIQLKASYMFLSIENIFKNVTKTSNKNELLLVIDFWVAETNHKYTSRFIVNISINLDTNYIKILHINTSNANNESSITNNRIGKISNLSNITGIDDITSLEFSPFIPTTKNDILPYLSETQRIIPPPNMVYTNNNRFPCIRNAFPLSWDSNGINIIDKKMPLECCNGMANTQQWKYPEIYDNPAFLKRVTDVDMNKSTISLMGAVNRSGAGRQVSI